MEQRSILEREGKYEKTMLAYFLANSAFLKRAIDNGLRSSWFLNKSNRDCCRLLIRYFWNHDGQVFNQEIIEDMLVNGNYDPSLIPVFADFFDKIVYYKKEDSSFDYYFSRFKSESVEVDIQDQISKYLNSIKEVGCESALEDLIYNLTRLSRDDGNKRVEIFSYYDDYDKQIEDLKQRIENKELYGGIKTNIPSLDKIFNGFEKDTLTLVAGMTGQGKSSFMRYIGYKISQARKNVLVFSMEDPGMIWMHKVTAAESKTPLTWLLKGEISAGSFEKIKSQKENRAHTPGYYYIVELAAKAFTVSELDTMIEEYTSEKYPDIVMVDQLSLVAFSKARYGDRFDMAYGDICKELRAMGKKYHVPIVLATQVNRQAVKGDPKKNERRVEINTENIANSDQAAQDADSVLAVIQRGGDMCDIKIVKQRNGPSDLITSLTFLKDICTFLDSSDILGQEQAVHLQGEVSAGLDTILTEAQNQGEVDLKQLEQQMMIGDQYRSVRSIDLMAQPVNDVLSSEIDYQSYIIPGGVYAPEG